MRANRRALQSTSPQQRRIAFPLLPWDDVPGESGIEVDPEIMSGAPVFTETRVPVETLFDYLMKGANIEEFLECFPTVKRQDALLLLDHYKQEALAEVAA